MKEHPQLFLKRLRRRYGDRKISHFLCGEYGEKSHRPHYHALLFGHDFADKVRLPRGGEPLYKSAELEGLWGLGFCSIGGVTFESAAYCARYVMKKIGGDFQREGLTRDGEIISRRPEYLSVSLRPAVGRGWIERYDQEVYPDDFIVARGRKTKVPRYYDKFCESVDAEGFRQVKLNRVDRASTRAVQENATVDRLHVRETVARARLALHGRSL